MALSVKQKLLLLIIPAVLGLIFFAYQVIFSSYQSSQGATLVKDLVYLSGLKSSLVHELQKERGATAGYLGSKAENFGNTLKTQRVDTDNKLKDLSAYLNLKKDSQDAPEILNAVAKVELHLANLNTIRERVVALNINSKEAIGYYTNTNTALLAINGLIIQESREPEITVLLSSFYEFLQGKERAGIERAVLSNVFSKQAFSEDMFAKFISLVAQQDSFFNTFMVYAKPAQVKLFKDTMNNPAVRAVEKYRQYAKEGILQQNAEEWFEEATKRIT